MSNTRQLLLVAEGAAIAYERAKAAVELAKAELETAKRQADDAKGVLDEAYAGLEEAGIPKAKARKAVEDIIGALAQIGIDVAADIGALAVPATSGSAVEPRTASRTPRRRNAPAAAAPQESQVPEDVHPYPADGGLRDQVREPSQTLSVDEVMRRHEDESDAVDHFPTPVEAAIALTTVDPAPESDDAPSPATVSEVHDAGFEPGGAPHDVEDAFGEPDDIHVDAPEEEGGEYASPEIDEIPDHVDLFGGDGEPSDGHDDEPEAVFAAAPAPASPQAIEPAPVSKPEGFRRPSFLNPKAPAA